LGLTTKLIVEEFWVGDIVGHGIGAALLMATIRASLRSRIRHPGSWAQIIGDVNVQLCEDTESSGNFASLFFMAINMRLNQVSWVRAGHDPAIVYTPASREFTELKGDGLVLGLDSDWEYQEYTHSIGPNEQVILIGSDGVWEAENTAGERFGKDRVRKALALKCYLAPDEIIQYITKEINTFCGGKIRDKFLKNIELSGLSELAYRCFTLLLLND